VSHAVINVFFDMYIWPKKPNLEDDSIHESQCKIRRNCRILLGLIFV
jgi:hypothetical protein